MRLLLLACALLTACIQSELVPCGEQLCARESMCINGQLCANADQLMKCAGSEDGTVCTLASGAVGRCIMQVCVIAACGNGRMDLGEVCDDGNVTAGDGCSGTCDSDETCGNGVLDVVKGESCDCGDGTPGHTPATCVTANSDDPASPCSADCKLRRCGDGIVAGPEQCDGSVDTTQVSCSRFGFYSGVVGCSSLCQFDPTGCTESCGDDIVQAAYELCDTKPPQDASCLDFGYDLGWLGCTSLCSADVVNCDRLGWARIHPRVAVAVNIVTRGGRVLIQFNDLKVSLLVDGNAVDPAGTFNAIAATPTMAFAVSTTTAMAYDATGWQALAAVPWSTPPRSAWASDSLGLFVIASNSSSLYRWKAGVWSTLTLPSVLTQGAFGRSRDKLYVFDRASATAYEWDGTNLLTITPPTGTTNVRDIANASTTIFMATEDGLFSRPQLSTTWNTENVLGSRLASNTLGGVDVLTTNGQIVRLGPGGSSFAAPTSTSVIDEDQGAMYVAGPPGGVFGLVKGAWQAVPDPTSAPTSYVHIHEATTKGDSTIVTGPLTAMRDPGSDWVVLPSQADTRDALLTVIGTVTIEPRTITVHSSSTTAYTLPVVDPYVMWEDTTLHKIWVAGDNGVASFDENTRAIVETVAPLRLRAISGTGPTSIVAAGTDISSGDGAIYVYSGAGWSLVDAGMSLKPVDDVFLASDGGIFAVGGEALYTGKLSSTDSWQTTAIPGATLTSVSGTSSNDLFISGGSTFGFPFSGLAHFDGTHLYPVRLPSAGVPHSMYVTRGAIYVLQANVSPPTDSIYQLVRTTTW